MSPQPLPSPWSYTIQQFEQKTRHFLAGDNPTDEKTPVPVVEPFRTKHVDRFLQTYDAAFEHDPLLQYLDKTPDAKKPSRFQRFVDSLIWKVTLSDPRTIAFTINAGDASVIAALPKDSVNKSSPVLRLAILCVLRILKSINFMCLSPEQKRRSKELAEKVPALNRKYISEEEEAGMIYVGHLSTHPDFQGRGYATALLNTVLLEADAQSGTSYLHTGNPANIKFYNLFGFEYVGEALMGEDNPHWHGLPVPIPLMIRKSREVNL